MRILVTSIVDLKKTSHNRLHQFIKYSSSHHHITVISINDWWKLAHSDVSQYLKGWDDVFQAIEVKYLTGRRIKPVWQETLSAITVGNILERVDYRSFDVHLNYSTLISGYFVARKLRTAGIHTVYDIADDLPQMVRVSPQIPPLLRPLGAKVADFMLRKNLGIATTVTLTTNSLKLSYQVPQAKCRIIPNGVDTELFKECPVPQLKEQLGLKQDFVLGYVGILREWLDFAPVFAAIKSLDGTYPGIKVLIVGEEIGLGKIKELTQRYGLSHRVVFTGTVPYSQVPQYISCMDVCLNPRRVSPVAQSMLPLKLFEYMACQKPVITTKLAATQEAVQDGVLYASNKTEYQEQIVKLYVDKKLRHNMGQQGRRLMEKNYSWRSAASTLEKVLEQAAKLRQNEQC